MMNAVRDRRLWLSLALAAVLFLLLNPMILRDFSMFQAHLNFEKRHMLVRSVHDASAVWHPLAAVPEIFLKILPRSLGWPIYLLGLGGMAVGFWRMRGKSLILLSFPVAFLLVLSQFQLINAKYLLPLTPFWLLFAAFALWEGGQWLYARLMASLKAEKIAGLHVLPVVFFTVVVCGLALPGWWESLAYVAVHRESDTRNLAHQAIQARAREGDRFFLEPDTLTMDNRLFRTRLTITDFHGGNFQLVRKTSFSENEPMAMALKRLRPRYILMNLGEAEKTRDARGQVFYRMPYASDYYEALQRHYRFSALFSPCPIRLSHRQIVTRLRAKSFGGLYEAIQHHKGRRNRPGPFLLLLERDR